MLPKANRVCLCKQNSSKIKTSERSNLLCVITCFLKRENTVPPQRLFPICLDDVDEVRQCFFQRHLALATHSYLFQMKSEMLSLSLPCHGCEALEGIYNDKVRPPLGIFGASMLTNLNY